MSDRPDEHDEEPSAPDPMVAYALRSMEPPPHGEAFWDQLDARVAAEPGTRATVVLGPEPPAGAPVADLVSMPAPRRRGPLPWWFAGAAAVLVVAAVAALLVSTADTDVKTTPAATAVPVETTVAPTTSAPAPPPTTATPTTASAPVRPVPTSASPTTATTAKPVSLTLSLNGVGPLRIGMTLQQAQATGAVGPFNDALDTGGACGSTSGSGPYRPGDFAALYLDGRLSRIYVDEGSRLRTPQGVGVGSAASKLSSIPGTRSESPHPYGAGTVVQIMSGEVGYQFTVVDAGTVRDWSVGTREALELPEGCA